jgi:hypothetical protein
MLHACLYTICLCFVTLRGVFMHFPELTYYQDATVPVPCFLLFLCFRKATQEIFSELEETKAEPPIFPNMRRSPKMRRRRSRAWPHPKAARPRPGPRHLGVSPLVHLLTPPIRLYVPLDGKNLNTRSIFLETYCKPPPSSTRDREGPEALPGTLPERRITTGGLFHHHGRLRSDV